jgi:predicted anti-sigma-YlaC factor YlaD
MKCEEVRKLIFDLLLGELEVLKEIMVNEHLLTCEGCRKEVEEAESFLESLRYTSQSIPDKRIFEKIEREMKLHLRNNPLTFLKKPVKLYHAILALLIGILAMSVVTFLITNQRTHTVERKEEYKTHDTSPPADSIIFYTAPSHRLGGS